MAGVVRQAEGKETGDLTQPLVAEMETARISLHLIGPTKIYAYETAQRKIAAPRIQILALPCAGGSQAHLRTPQGGHVRN